jgi:hypothetical protein
VITKRLQSDINSLKSVHSTNKTWNEESTGAEQCRNRKHLGFQLQNTTFAHLTVFLAISINDYDSIFQRTWTQTTTYATKLETISHYWTHTIVSLYLTKSFKQLNLAVHRTTITPFLYKKLVIASISIFSQLMSNTLCHNLKLSTKLSKSHACKHATLTWLLL